MMRSYIIRRLLSNNPTPAKGLEKVGEGSIKPSVSGPSALPPSVPSSSVLTRVTGLTAIGLSGFGAYVLYSGKGVTAAIDNIKGFVSGSPPVSNSKKKEKEIDPVKEGKLKEDVLKVLNTSKTANGSANKEAKEKVAPSSNKVTDSNQVQVAPVAAPVSPPGPVTPEIKKEVKNASVQTEEKSKDITVKKEPVVALEKLENAKQDKKNTEAKTPAVTTEKENVPPPVPEAVPTKSVPVVVVEQVPSSPVVKPVAEKPQAISAPAATLAEEMSLKLQQLKNEVLISSSQQVKSLIELQMHQTILQNVTDLSRPQLIERVTVLASELKDRTALEAVRMHHLLQKQEESMHAKTVSILDEQAKQFKRILDSEMERVGSNMEKLHVEEMEIIKNRSFIESLKRMNHYESASRSRVHSIINEETHRVSQQWRSLLQDIKHNHNMQSYVSRLQHLRTLRDLQIETSPLAPMLQTTDAYEQGSKQINTLLSAFNFLAPLANTNKPFVEEMALLKAASLGDDFIQTILQSVPSHVVNGVPNRLQLRLLYKKAEENVRVVSRTPPQSGIAGYLLGVISSQLSFSPSRASDIDDKIDEILLKAEKYLANGNLESTLNELSKLPERESKAVGTFLQSVKERVLLDQAIKAIKAHLSLLSASLVN